MSRSNLSFEINSIVKGLLTEASPLNFPQDASIDESNFVLNRDGSRHRRLGMDLEPGAVMREVPHGTSVVPYAYTTYLWTDSEGLGNVEIVVVQSGDVLRFFEAGKLPLSDALLYEYTIPSQDPYQPLQYSSLGNSLVVVLGVPTIIVFDVVEGGIEPRYGRLKVRDLFGIEDIQDGTGVDLREGNAVSTRPPGPITDQHLYNLRNQTWAIPMRKDGEEVLSDTIKALVDTAPSSGGAAGFFPSNSDNANAYMAPITDDSDDRVGYRFNSQAAASESPGTSEAPRGHFIIDLLERSFSRFEEHAKYYASWEGKGATGGHALSYNITDLPLDITEKGASVVSTFAGRFFYAGFNGNNLGGDKHSPHLASYVLFSQLLSGTGAAFSCYQQGDPTNRTGFELIDTDGGFIDIKGARKINRMVPYKDSLLVFAENGVWAIRGGSGYGFTATDYRVDKITSAGCSGPYTVVDAGDTVFYWSGAGIYVISLGEGGVLSSDNLTETTIQTFYNTIDTAAARDAQGMYDEAEGRVLWVYNDDESSKELIFDTTLGAFYKNNLTKRVLSVEDFNMLYTTDGDEFIQLREDRLDLPGKEAKIINAGGSYFLYNDAASPDTRQKIMLSPDDFSYEAPLFQAVYDNPIGTESFGNIDGRFYGLKRDITTDPPDGARWDNLLIANSVDGVGWAEGFFVGRPGSVVVAGTPALKVAVTRASQTQWGQVQVQFGTPLFVSENGGGWRIVDDPVLRDKNIEHVHYHNGRFTACVFDSVNRRSLATSTNGYDWTKINVITYFGLVGGSSTIDRVVNQGNNLLAYGRSHIFCSPDGLSWMASDGEGSFSLSNNAPVVVSGGGYFVLLDPDFPNGIRRSYRSVDGEYFEEGPDLYPNNPGMGVELTSFLHNGVEFVFTVDKPTNNLFRSVDGLTWTVETIVGPRMEGVIDAGDVYIGSDGSDTYSSTDGINWTLIPGNPTNVGGVQYATKIGDTYWFEHGFFAHTDDWSQPLELDSFGWANHRGWKQLVGDGTRVVGLCYTEDPFDTTDGPTKPVSYYSLNGNVFIPSTTQTGYDNAGVLFHDNGSFLAACWAAPDFGDPIGPIRVMHSTDGDVWQETTNFIADGSLYPHVKAIAKNSTGILMLMGSDVTNPLDPHLMKVWRDNTFWEDTSSFFPPEFHPFDAATFKNRVYVTGWWNNGVNGRAQIYSSLDLRNWSLEWDTTMSLSEGINYLSSVDTDGNSLVFKGILQQ